MNKNIRYSYSFFDKFAIEAKIPNTLDTVLRNRETDQLVLMKQIPVVPQDYDQTISTLEYQKNLSHEQLLSLMDYHGQPSQDKILVLYEFCSISLMDQFQNRLAQRRYFQESELWSIFTSLVFGLAYLQEQNVGHGSVSLYDCFLNQQGFIKVADPTCASSNPYTIAQGYFYSPEILRCLLNETCEQINIFKSDVFALGCCMLQLSLMRQLQQVFDYENGSVSRNQLNCMLKEIEAIGFSREYVGFINQLLIFDYHKRPDFLALKTEIFGLLSLDPNQKSEQMMRQSYDIKSSISSMCRSKGQAYFEIVDKKIASRDITQNSKFTSNQRKAKQQRQPLKQTSKFGTSNVSFKTNNKAPTKFEKMLPNLDELLGNMKKSVDLSQSELIKQINLLNNGQQLINESQPARSSKPEQQRQSNQNKKKAEIVSKQNNLPKIAQLQSSIETDIFIQNSKISTNTYESQTRIINIQGQSPRKSKIFTLQTEIDRIFMQQSRKTQAQPPSDFGLKLARKQPARQQIYTDPDFLKMMQADVQRILSKRPSFV